MTQNTDTDKRMDLINESIIGPRRIKLYSTPGYHRPFYIEVQGKSRFNNESGFCADKEQAYAYYQKVCDKYTRYEAIKDERKAERKAARAALVNPYKVGDILYNSWGYEQTNIDFYQVIEARAKSVVIREIAAESQGLTGNGMADHCVPVKDHFIGAPETKVLQVSVYNGTVQAYISARHGCISAWNGRPLYRSWYA